MGFLCWISLLRVENCLILVQITFKSDNGVGTISFPLFYISSLTNLFRDDKKNTVAAVFSCWCINLIVKILPFVLPLPDTRRIVCIDRIVRSDNDNKFKPMRTFCAGLHWSSYQLPLSIFTFLVIPFNEMTETKRAAAWYHGGVASAGAAMCTHPLDLLKVHLQTQQKAQKGLIGMISDSWSTNFSNDAANVSVHIDLAVRLSSVSWN